MYNGERYSVRFRRDVPIITLENNTQSAVIANFSQMIAQATNNSIALQFICNNNLYTLRMRTDTAMLTFEDTTHSRVIWNIT